jgi:predicted methyltransferase
MRHLFILICLTFSIQQVQAQYQPPKLTPVQEKIQQVMQSDIRTDAEQARDRDRNPIRTLDFFGLKDDMTVLELIPAGGWYTKILGPVLRDKGRLYIVEPDFYITRTDEALKLPGMDKVRRIAWGTWKGQLDPNVRTLPPPGDWDIKNIDMVLTFRNYHNFSKQARAVLDKEVFDTLKPGGLYGIIDHTRRHMEPDYRENGRRVDPVEVIKEVQATGFVFVDYSDVHFKPDDELRYEVGRASVTGNTDRFTLLFKKPE